ncbi:hypothetical protein ABMC88_14555 [Sulfitobacter sp. HNIBRBA2951]|uniref:hypothetical protein n=1 Tax=Sulfitobacter aquimarinus TaxID=3158557 RepID=UPI0032DED278
MPDKLTTIARVEGPFAVALVMAKLGGAGIWAMVDIFHMATNHSHAAIAFGGARVMVLERDAFDAAHVLADGPPIVSTGLRGWRVLVAVFFLLQCGAGPAPFAVYLQRPRNQIEVTARI